jgi:ATP-dependent exoDNAse (exonuclease V) alpha subunit
MNKTDVFVIDEISMVENYFFTRLNEVMKEARGSRKPFGGVQLVVTGDVNVIATLGYAKTNSIPSSAKSPQ